MSSGLNSLIPVLFDLGTVTSDTTLQNGWTVTGTLDGNTQKYKITIADNATVRLHNANINGINSGDWAGITCQNATIILDAGTTNNVKGFMDGNAGIHVKPGCTLTIDGEGTHEYYDLSGRKLSRKPQRGIYIDNGKKRINKYN
jgi:hypothetical protein